MIGKVRHIKLRKGTKIGLLALVAVIALSAFAVAAAMADGPGQQPPPGGQYPPPPGGQQPPGGGQYPPPGGQQPPGGGQYPPGPGGGQPGGQPGGPGGGKGGPPGPPGGGPNGGPCITPPAGVDPGAAGPVFGQVPDAMKSLGHPATAADVDEIVPQAAAKAGVTDPAVINFVKDEIKSHLPGGKCEGQGGQFDPVSEGQANGGFDKKFVNHVWTIVVRPDDASGKILSATLVKIADLPKSLSDQDDDLISEDCRVVFSNTKARQEGGDAIALSNLADAKKVTLRAKLMSKQNWQSDDSDGTPITTFQGKKITKVQN